MVQANVCTVLPLQEEWNSYGPDAFRFEVLESIEQGEAQSPQDFHEDVKALEELWRETFSLSSETDVKPKK